MKKSLFIIFFILVIMCSTVVFGATFSDVRGTKYQEAVDMLTALSVVNGYSDSTYKPNNVVKRSEMAKLLVVTIGKESEAKLFSEKTIFSDVSTDHWAYGYINVAVKEGLIKGYPNGTFAPEETVTYAEAVTMLIRALGYGDVVEKSGVWPSNYMSKATELNVLKDVTVGKNDNGAIRGNTAILVWNTLKTGTCTVVSENKNGLVYGPGKSLISQKMPDYICASKSQIIDIDISNNEITFVDIDGNMIAKQVEDEDLKKICGKEITAVYNTKSKKFYKLNIDEDVDTIKGEVDKVYNGKIYVKDEAYTLPSNKYIKLIGISNISDAEEAYVTLKDGKVKYVVAIGTEDLYYGIVTDTNVTVNGNKAVKLNTLDGKETIELGSNNKFSKYDVLVYTLNKDEELVLKANRDIGDSLAIESYTTYSIKLKGKNKFTFSSKKEFKVLLVDGTSIEEISMSEINKKTNSAVIAQVNGYSVIIVFADGLEEIEEYDGELTKSEAKSKLASAIKKANALSETKYSISSYEYMKRYLKVAQGINTSTASISKIVSATTNLQDAIDELSLATTTDKSIRSAYSKLQTTINKAKTYNSKDYTEASYNLLKTALTAAENIIITNTTETRINTANTNIENAINKLVANISDEVTNAKKVELNNLILKAKAYTESEYTVETYAKLKTALTKANSIDYTSGGAIYYILDAIDDLETAIAGLQTKAAENLKIAKQKLNSMIVTAESKIESDYTIDTWKPFEDALLEAREVKTNIDTAETAEILVVVDRLKETIDGLVTKVEEAAKENCISVLETLILSAKEYDENEWIVFNSTVTWSALQTAIENAEKVVENKEDKTLAQVKAVKEILEKYLGI